MAASTISCNVTSNRLLVTDQLSKRQFLIDTCLDLCIFPFSFLSLRKRDPNFQVKAGHNSTVKPYSIMTLSLDLGLLRTFGDL
ncbi:hypothetical protein TNCT_9011 [Trichonephila clavata]|uniref:Uncharacterized protein n=1 Tax=Trichonephila clavata TaxID=2740835 RepID=A0A8X6L827_TRICU|nr:hypothetical protein TNCT_9011 [Trichonephila clavata]